MEEKVDFYTTSKKLAKQVGLKFEREITDYINETDEYYFNLPKDRLISYLDKIDSSLGNTSYQVFTNEDRDVESLEELIIKERFSDGLVSRNTFNSKSYTQNGITLRIAS
jgi:hypothetical protein|tara:strand:- start:163 stop:492 length:330 start_codon:yes stop_codon:yes gene_type:complete